MQNIYQTFEFNKIKEEINKYAKTEVGKEKSLSLEMSSSFEEVDSLLKDLDEMYSIYLRYGDFPISTSANALRLIEIAKKTALLSIRDLSLIAEDVLTSIKIKKFLSKIDVNYPRLSEKVEKFFDLSNLEKEIHRVITSSLTIDDKATNELKEIRGELKKLEATLIQKSASISLSYSSYLSDSNPTIRDGHYVLPVKTAYKNKVLGIIYDVSDSGNTTFIEPLEIVQLNNKITELKVRENEEIRKILKALTALVLIQEHEIVNNNAIIAEIDFLLAKSKYASEISGVIASLSPLQEISLCDARHPLIDKDKVVSNSYIFDEHSRIIVISGPNAGGKTVSLKTVGLLVLMNQCGLALPTSKAKLGIFNHIYIDIGDNQSLADNLSTFSAHISQISEILSLVKGKDLLLFDELGTGTDPKEGEAIALAVLKYLENKHCLAMISSHFGKLKEYAFTSSYIENSSMIFDEEKLVPTYRFKEGSVGKSYGIEVANRFHLPPQVIKEARDILLKNEEKESDKLLSILQQKVIENERLSHDLSLRKENIEKEEKRLEIASNNLKQNREDLLRSVKEEKEDILEKTKKQVDDLIKEMMNGDKKVHEVIEIKKKLEELEEEEEHVLFNEQLNVGDYISYPFLNIEGKLIKIKNNGNGLIATSEGMNIEVPLGECHKIEQVNNHKVNKTKESFAYVDHIDTSLGIELNIIGCRYEEGKDKLIKYLDAVRLKRIKTVRIIHGFGSGVLRKMTHEYLKSQKDLSFRLGDISEGGSGATVVTFND